MSEEYAISELCQTLEVARSGYYAWIDQAVGARATANRGLSVQIQEVFLKHQRRYGSPRVTAELHRAGQRCNHKRVERLMREGGLRARSRRHRRPRTTWSNHSSPIAPNLLTGKEPPRAVDQVWVSDITYLPTAEGWLYLAAVMDLYSRRIIGWALKETLETELPLKALEKAIGQRNPRGEVIHHSDRGCQYASYRYRHKLKERKIKPSMSGRGNCYDNAAMESFWSTLKLELSAVPEEMTKQELQRMIFEYIEAYYNRERLHSSLGYKSPVEFENNINQ